MSGRPFQGHAQDEGHGLDHAGRPLQTISQSMDGATFILLGIMIAVIGALIFLAAFNCWIRCVAKRRGSSRRASLRSNDVRYVAQVRRLIKVQSNIEKLREDGIGVPSPAQVESAHQRGKKVLIKISPDKNSVIEASPRANRRVRISNSVVSTNPKVKQQLEDLRTELEPYRIPEDEIEEKAPLCAPSPSNSPSNPTTPVKKRRTWGGIVDGITEVVPDNQPVILYTDDCTQTVEDEIIGGQDFVDGIQSPDFLIPSPSPGPSPGQSPVAPRKVSTGVSTDDFGIAVDYDGPSSSQTSKLSPSRKAKSAETTV